MDKNNLSIQASLDTSKLKKDLEKFEGEVKLNADTKSLRKQLEATLKGITVKPSLDTNQLEKQMEKFNGVLKVNADTNTLRQQLKSTIANVSQNATANIHCSLSGIDTVMGQLQNAASSNHDIRLNVSSDTSGLQQYTAQLEKLVQLNSQIQLPTVNSITPPISTDITKADASFTSDAATGFKEATTESNNFTNTLSKISTVASLLTATFNMPNAFKGFTENLD